ncbi:MAG: DUF58 domain-containing protein [Candidatus Riflebacteria bacterium]|nr:DUF58 domain-containing protein [Candidatus Riflebacteria bacterium]
MVHKLLQSSIEAAEIAGQRFYLNISSRFSGLQGGSRFGRNTGNSLEFLDHREYQPGDDVRHIDWNAMARSDRLTVKLFREEISPHLDILIDTSLSMAGETFHKGAATMALAALLRVAAYNAGYTVSCWLLKDRCRRIEPANLPLTQWPGAEFDYSGNVGETITSFPPRLRNNGARILLSDLFWSQEPVSVLRQLSDGAALLTVVQMLAKEDIAPEFAGNIRLIDCETTEAVELIADESLISEYLRNFTRHQEYWKKCCSKYGAVFTHCIGEQLLSDFVPVELLKTEIIMTRS